MTFRETGQWASLTAALNSRVAYLCGFPQWGIIFCVCCSLSWDNLSLEAWKKTPFFPLLRFHAVGVCGEAAGGSKCNQPSFNGLKVICNSVFSIAQRSGLGNYYSLLQKGAISDEDFLLSRTSDKPKNWIKTLTGFSTVNFLESCSEWWLSESICSFHIE